MCTKIRAITTDNGSEMPPAMKIVMEYLNERYTLKLECDWYIRFVCHIVNRAVVDCEALVQQLVAKLKEILKAIRNTLLMRHKFKEAQALLGKTTMKEVPSLDVDTRWNSIFIMIDVCFELRSVFVAMANQPEFSGKLGRLTELEWRQVKSVKDFLQPVYEMKTMVCGSKYPTLGIHPLIFESLESHCVDTIIGNLATGFKTPMSKQADQAMLNKLKKYKEHLNSPLAKLAVLLAQQRQMSRKTFTI